MSMAPLVLLPGTLCDERIWEGVRKHVPVDRDIICPRYRRGDTMAEVVSHLKAELPDRFALAGFSLGGFAALELVNQYPSAVERLALISSHAQVDTNEVIDQRRRQLDRAKEKGLEALVNDLFVSNGLTAGHPKFQNNASLLCAMAGQYGYSGFERQTRMALTRIDHHHTLAEFAKPILILATPDDQMCVSAKPQAAYKASPGAQIEWIGDSGHYLPLEQPAKVAQALTGWLEDSE